MNSHPILFTSPMVRAILDGSKTQTRKVVKPCKDHYTGCNLAPCEIAGEINGERYENSNYIPGDQLWVRETWQYFDWTEDGEPCIAFAADNTTAWPSTPADEEQLMKIEDAWVNLSEPKNYLIDNRASDKKWRPSIFMPRWASRITLEITGVRVEKLQDISYADAKAEGVTEVTDYLGDLPACISHRYAYEDLWRSINGPGSWDANPWVWVVEFKRVKP